MGLGSLPIVGSLLGGGPELSVAPLDAGTKKLIDEGVKRNVGENTDDITNQLTRGIDNGQLLQTPEQTNQTAEQAGQDPHLLQAIRRQYSDKTNQSVQRLKNQAGVDARLEKGKRMRDFSHVAIAKQQVETQTFQALSQAYQQNQQARAQMISSLINLGGTAMMIQGMKPKVQVGAGGSGGGFQAPTSGMGSVMPQMLGEI